MSKSKLNTSRVLSELTGKSKFFDKPKGQTGEKEIKPIHDKSFESKPKNKEQYTNIAIVQLDEQQINSLRFSTQKAQTFRFTDQEIEWLKDTAYTLSKVLPHRRVNQTDIIRIGIKLFEKSLEINQSSILSIIEKIK